MCITLTMELSCLSASFRAWECGTFSGISTAFMAAMKCPRYDPGVVPTGLMSTATNRSTTSGCETESDQSMFQTNSLSRVSGAWPSKAQMSPMLSMGYLRLIEHYENPGRCSSPSVVPAAWLSFLPCCGQ